MMSRMGRVKYTCTHTQQTVEYCSLIAHFYQPSNEKDAMMEKTNIK